MARTRCGGFNYDQDGGQKDCLAVTEHHCHECEGDYCGEHFSETWEECLGCLDVDFLDEVPDRCQGCGAALDPELGGHCPGCS